MLPAPGGEIAGLDLEELTIEVLSPDPGRLRPADLHPNLRNTQAPFFMAHDLALEVDLRIHEDHRLPLRIHLGIGHEHPDRSSHLRSGKADAIRLVHGHDHPLGQGPQIRVESLDRRGFPA